MPVPGGVIRQARRSAIGEAAVRDVLLVEAFETVDPPPAHWTADDAAWATRAAREAAPGSGSTGSVANFLARRAALAVRRIEPREPAVAALRRTGPPGARWLAGAIALGFAVGVAADAVGGTQRIDLLAPPVWTIVAWNLVVYLLLAVAAVRGAVGRGTDRPGAGARLVAGLQRAAVLDPARAPGATAGGTAAALRRFSTRWSAAAAPLVARRAAISLHAAAAALGLGLVAGLYARGLVLDYRVAWQSTFLSPADVHVALVTLLAPASRATGVALPDVAAVAALRVAHGDAAAIGAPAAPWIHLYATTAMLAVVLPRTVLAAVAAARARALSAGLSLPLGEPYFRRLDGAWRGAVLPVRVCPYAQSPSASALAGLQALLAASLGAVAVEVAATVPFGAEDAAAPRHVEDDVLRRPRERGAVSPVDADDAALVVALFDLSATPEPEHHGRFVDMLGHAAPPVVLVDETAFRRRFGAVPARVDERRAAWSRLAESHGAVAVFADLAGDRAAAQESLRRAFALPR